MALSDYPTRHEEQVHPTENPSMLPKEESPTSYTSSMWDPLLTQQLRVLLHTDRLLSLQHRDDHRSAEYQHYSSLSLALKVFDLIIAHTGLGQDIEHDQAVNALLPLLEAMDHAANVLPDRERQVRMAERVLATLLNEDDSRQPFKLTYTTFEQGNAVKRVLSVRLLEERHHVDGRIVLRLSNESANLLLNALTIDLEDAQAAAEAIIQSQLARGRIQEARVSAQWALQQSVRLREHIEHRLFATRRDFQSVDWKQDMHRMVDEALVHVRDRCTVENNIVVTAREQREQLASGSEKSYQLTEIISLVDACRQQHLALQRRLMEAPRVFFEEQERQIFTFRPPQTFPHPQNDLLAPLLRSPRVQVMQTLDILVSACLPATPPDVFSLARYLHYLLQPRREVRTDTIPILPPDLIDANYDSSSFTLGIVRQAETYFSNVEKPERLSQIVQKAQIAGEPLSVIEALVFLVMDYFDPQDSSKPDDLPIHVFKRDGQQFWLNNVAGDDVLLVPKEEQDASQYSDAY